MLSLTQTAFRTSVSVKLLFCLSVLSYKWCHFGLFQFPVKEFGVMPVQRHAMAFGLFASLVAPFGGFFASGFKRAFKIKVISCNQFCIDIRLRGFCALLSRTWLFILFCERISCMGYENVGSSGLGCKPCLQSSTICI